MTIERRKAFRFSLGSEFSRQVAFYPFGFRRIIKAQYTGSVADLSEEGMTATIDARVKKRAKLFVVFGFQGPLKGLRIRGKVLHAESAGAGTQVGIQFVKADPQALELIKKMGDGHRSCEVKISFKLKDVCVRDCAYWPVCRKPIKLPDAQPQKGTL